MGRAQVGRASSRDRGQPESYRAGLSRGPQSAHDQGIISGSPRGLTWMSLNPGLDVVPGPHSPRSAVPRRLRAPGNTSPPTSVPRSAPRPFPSRSSPVGHGEPQAPGPASQRTVAWATLQADHCPPPTAGPTAARGASTVTAGVGPERPPARGSQATVY